MNRQIEKSKIAEADILNEAAVDAWEKGEESKAVSLAEQAVAANPLDSFARINLHNFKECIAALKKAEATKNARRIEKLFENNPPPNPLVSVILPTYDRPDFFKEALDSVLAQTMRDFEVVVVNDGGNDIAETICRDAADNRIRYAKVTHSGLSGALNAGLELSRGKFVAYLDDDDLYKPEHLEILLKEILRDKNTVVYSDADKIVGEKTGGQWRWSAPSPFYREDFDKNKLFEANYIHNQCAMHRREIAIEAGGYHEGIDFTVNWEMWIKLAKRYIFKRVPVATVIYRDRKTGDTMSSDPMRKRQRSRNIVSYTHRIFAMRKSKIAGGNKLDKALGDIIGDNEDVIDFLDLRKVKSGKAYSLFYELGKYFQAADKTTEARKCFKNAARMAPWEAKSYFKLIGSYVRTARIEKENGKQ